MADQLPNQYSLSNLPGIDPHVRRVMQDMTDRINYLTGELDKVRGDIPEPGAKRERPQPGVITVPSPNGDGIIRVSPDGVIKSYVNPTWNPELSGFCLYTNTSNATTITNTTTETSLFAGAGVSYNSTRVIPSGTLKTGFNYRMRVGGFYTTNSTPTGRLRLRFNTTLIADTGAFTMPNVAAAGPAFVFDTDFFFTGGTVISRFGLLTLMPVTNGTAPLVAACVGFATVDPGVAQTIDLTWEWGAAAASNQIQMFGGVIQKVRG